jgi:hypothetical protein
MKTTGLTHVSIAILILPACLNCCTGNDPVNTDGTAESPITIPMAIGVLWIYEVHDNLAEVTDTIQVSIVDTVSTGDGSFFTVWKYNRSDVISTRYIEVAGDTLVIRHDTLNLQPCEYLVFPLKVGRRWTVPCGFRDTSWVTHSGRISVPAGDFDNGFQIDRLWNFDIEGGGNRSTTWIVPEVGIVFRHLLSQFSDGSTTTFTADEEWRLLSHDLSTFEID